MFDIHSTVFALRGFPPITAAIIDELEKEYCNLLAADLGGTHLRYSELYPFRLTKFQ